jgi:ABC-type transporter Mla maintaining outer membrane lipid asymmetry ATPase subunit MlaF
MELIANIQRESKTTMIVVSQDLRRLLPMVERVVALFDGQIAAHCGVGDLANCDPLVTRFVACRFDL